MWIIWSEYFRTKISPYLIFFGTHFSVLETHQIKSLQWQQNVGCLKKRGMNLWSLTSEMFFFLRAPFLARSLDVSTSSSPGQKVVIFSFKKNLFSISGSNHELLDGTTHGSFLGMFRQKKLSSWFLHHPIFCPLIPKLCSVKSEH